MGNRPALAEQDRLDRQLRLAAKAGDAAKAGQLLRAGADPWAQAGARFEAAQGSDAALGDTAAIAACRAGSCEALGALRGSGVEKPGRAGAMRSADGMDCAMAAVAAKSPGGQECLEMLWAGHQGLFAPECLAGEDGALRQACKSGNAEALLFLIQQLSSSAMLAGAGGAHAVRSSFARRGERGRSGLLWALASGSEPCARAVGSMMSEPMLRAALGERGDDGRGAWACAAEGGEWRCALLCAEWADRGMGPPREGVAWRGADGASAVEMSAAMGDLDTAKALWRCAPAGDRERLAVWAAASAGAAGKGHVRAWFEAQSKRAAGFAALADAAKRGREAMLGAGAGEARAEGSAGRSGSSRR